MPCCLPFCCCSYCQAEQMEKGERAPLLRIGSSIQEEVRFTTKYPALYAFFQVILVAAVVGGASLSGVSGAIEKYGLAIALNSFVAMFALNLDGFDSTYKKLTLQREEFKHISVEEKHKFDLLPEAEKQRLTEYCGVRDYFGIRKRHVKLAGLMILALLASIPTAVLAGEGGSALFKSSSLGASLPFLLLNLVVSTMVNMQSFASILPNIKKFCETFIVEPFKKLRSEAAWDLKTLGTIAIFVLGIVLLCYGIFYAGPAATIARGASSFFLMEGWFTSVASWLGVGDVFVTILSYVGLGITSAPGFMMFLSGLTGVFNYIAEQIEEYRKKVSATSATSTSAKILALIFTLYCAVFAALNYVGLADAAYTDDWALARFLHFWYADNLHNYEGNAAAINGLNLLKRAKDFGPRFETIGEKGLGCVRACKAKGAELIDGLFHQANGVATRASTTARQVASQVVDGAGHNGAYHDMV